MHQLDGSLAGFTPDHGTRAADVEVTITRQILREAAWPELPCPAATLLTATAAECT